MALNIVLNQEKNGFLQSRMGGVPYWPGTAMEFPTDENGKKMVLLCQINLQEVAVADPDSLLPKTGMLQLFICEDDEFYGMCFENMFDQKNFRLVYHVEVDENVTPEQVAALGVSDGAGAKSPVRIPMGFDFERCTNIEETAKKSCLLGMPEFTQDDPRQNLTVEDEEYLDTCLLKLMSGKEICWGDKGIGVILMNEEALKKGDFSRVLFSWDCY